MAGVDIGWLRWFVAAVGFALPLLALVPLLGFVLYPPELKSSPEVPAWAVGELSRLGPLSRREPAARRPAGPPGRASDRTA